MAIVIESGVGFATYVKQTAKGTTPNPAAAVNRSRTKHVSGGFKSGKVLGSEEYSDGNRFGSPSVFTNFTGGQVGQIGIQAQPENTGLFFAQILGSDVVTGASDPYTHTITPSNNGGAWGGWFLKAGQNVGPQRELYWDSKISKLTMSNPRDRNVMHLDMDVASLKPAEVYTVEPSATEATSDPFYATDATGGTTFDGTVISEIEDSVTEVDTGIEPFWGDSVEPLQLIEKKGAITASVSSIVTDETILKYRKALYNATAPAAGVRPVKNVFYAAATRIWTQSATRTCTVTTPKIAVDPSNFEEIAAPMAEGGKRTIQFGGRCLKDGVNAPITVVVLSADSAAWV